MGNIVCNSVMQWQKLAGDRVGFLRAGHAAAAQMKPEHAPVNNCLIMQPQTARLPPDHWRAMSHHRPFFLCNTHQAPHPGG
jgi:hypothetical protein